MKHALRKLGLTEIPPGACHIHSGARGRLSRTPCAPRSRAAISRQVAPEWRELSAHSSNQQVEEPHKKPIWSFKWTFNYIPVRYLR